MAQTPEGKVKKDFKDEMIRLLGTDTTLITPIGGSFARNSEPDNVWTVLGIPVMLEMKAEGPSPTGAQLARLKEHYAAGAMVGCVGGKAAAIGVEGAAYGSAWLCSKFAPDGGETLFDMRVIAIPSCSPTEAARAVFFAHQTHLRGLLANAGNTGTPA